MKFFLKCLSILFFLGLTYGKSCTNNNNCLYLYHCNIKAKECVHNPLFPMHYVQIIGVILIGIVVGLANAGGIGGGPLMVSLALGFFNYNIKGNCFLSL